MSKLISNFIEYEGVLLSFIASIKGKVIFDEQAIRLFFSFY
jgi:hypothetical protein